MEDLLSLLATADQISAQRTNDALNIPGARKLTQDEIDDILTVLRAPVCMIPSYREEIYRAHYEKCEADFKKYSIIPAAIPRLKELFAKVCLLAPIPAGTPIGGIVADNVSSGTYQGTLNTRHTPGSRQKASVGIKGQREILQLNKRSQPIVILAFTVRLTFEQIMKDVRARLMEIKLKDLVYRQTPAMDIQHITVNERPAWYKYFTVPASTDAIVFKIRRDIMYINQITIGDIYDKISDAGWLMLYSPLDTRADYTVHIYSSGTRVPVPSEVEPEETTPTEDTETTPTEIPQLHLQSDLGLLYTIITTIGDLSITGMEGIKDIVPYSVPVLSVVDSVAGNVIRLDPIKSKRLGITTADINRLCGVVGVASTRIISPTEIDVDVGSSTITEYLRRQTLTPDERNLVANIQEGPDRTFTNGIANPDQLLHLLKRIGLTVAKVANAPYPYKATISGNPVDYLKAAIEQDRTQQLAYENTQRNKRFAGDKRVSVLRPPTEIEKASVVYFAESIGGSFSQFIDIDLTMNIPVDINRTYSNDAKEMLAYLGIDGAYSFLEVEIYDQYSDVGFPLEPLSIIKLANAMTYRGFLVPMTHPGVAAGDIGPIAQSAVMRPMTFFAKAALNEKVDPLNTATGGIMMGKTLNLGTGLPQTQTTIKLNAPPTAPDIDQIQNQKKFVRDIDDF